MMAHHNFTSLALRSLVSRHLRFVADQRGTSAVEFAVLLPLMLTMYFGSIVVTDAISADRQVTLVASTVAEITSQYTEMVVNDIQNVLGNSGSSPPGGAASAVLQPFPVSNAQVTLSSVVIDGNSVAHIDWSATLYGTQRTGIVTALIPQGLLVPCTSVIWGEATYNYKPVIGSAFTGITGTIPLYDQIFLRPRQSSCVQYNGTLCPSMLTGCVPANG
jgi:Flp pilus assembly protein TadG